MTEIRPVGVALIRAEKLMDRRYDMAKLITASRDSASAHEKRYDDDDDVDDDDVRNH